MVVLHVNSTTSSCSSPSPGEETEFLHECAATAAVADVAAALAGTAALQARLFSLCRRLRERCADAGAAGGELERALSEAEAYASKVQVQHNKFLSPRALREHIKNIEKTTASVLQGPSEALCPQHLESDEKLDSVQLWWAGKELAMDKKLSDYIGTNDKTKSSTCIGIAAIMEPPSCEILGVTYGRCLPAWTQFLAYLMQLEQVRNQEMLLLAWESNTVQEPARQGCALWALLQSWSFLLRT